MKFALALSALLLSACVSKDLRALDDTARGAGVSNVTVIAHRGASAYAPENTFAAFDKAQDLGAVAAETDVQLSKDGKLVIFHDDTLDEKTSLKGAVHDHAWTELSAIDMAPWFARTHASTTTDVKADAAATPSRVKTEGTASVAPSKKARAGGKRILSKRSRSKTTREATPTNPLTHVISLDDLFERYGMTFEYNVEIKGPEAEIPQLLLQTIKDFGMQDNVTVTSFRVDQLTRARALDRDVPLCYLIDDKKTPDINGEIARARTLGFNEVSVRAPIVTPEIVAHARASGLKIISWGVQSDDDMKHAVQAGVSGMTTNWPDHLMQILKLPIVR